MSEKRGGGVYSCKQRGKVQSLALVEGLCLPPQPKIPKDCDRNFRSKFIFDRNCLSNFSSEIRSDLISHQIFDQFCGQILFPIGFAVEFLSTFLSDPTVINQNFRSEILSEIWAGAAWSADFGMTPIQI